MSLADFKGRVYAFQEFCKRADTDRQAPRLKPVRVSWRWLVKLQAAMQTYRERK